MEYSEGGCCWSCGSRLGPLDFGRSDRCQKCGRDTRVCKGCKFFDPSANNQCRENQADRVVEKERSNFCDYFVPLTEVSATGAVSREALKSVAESLFKKK